MKRPTKHTVVVLDIAPWLTDSELRYYAKAFVGSIFPWRDFKESLPDGCFNGLKVFMHDTNYIVRDGMLVPEGQPAYQQMQLEGVTG